MRLIPTAPSRVLDIGSDTGRDAAGFATAQAARGFRPDFTNSVIRKAETSASITVMPTAMRGGSPNWLAPAVAEHPDIIVTSGTVVTRSIARQTTTIPIVSISGDPVGSGFIASLARPGGNITGLTVAVGPELAGKWLRLIVEIVPCARGSPCYETRSIR